MQGRYGVDSLSRFLSGVLIAIIVLGLFIPIPFSGLITLALLVILYWRMFSKNIPRRYEENQKFLELKDKFMGRFSNFSSNVSQFKEYHIYK
jgi:4-hydroxybenzoate polyprenyltransferase